MLTKTSDFLKTTNCADSTQASGRLGAGVIAAITLVGVTIVVAAVVAYVCCRRANVQTEDDSVQAEEESDSGGF
jgi:hypothetical protein